MSEIASLPENVELAEIIQRLYQLMKAQGRLTAGASPDRQLSEAEQQEAWRLWSHRGPQGPIEEDGDDWP